MVEMIKEFESMARKLHTDLANTLIIDNPRDEAYQHECVAYLSGWLKHNFYQYLDVCCSECECNEDSDSDPERPSRMEDRDSR